MVVTNLGGIVGFSVGLEVKNSCGPWGYIEITRAGLGLFKISWGKNLKGKVGLLFDGFASSSGCLQLCCLDRKPGSDTKIDVGQLHYFNGIINQQKNKG